MYENYTGCLFENFLANFVEMFERYKRNLKHVFHDFEEERKRYYQFYLGVFKII